MTWAEFEIMFKQYEEFAGWAGLAFVAFVLALALGLWIGARK